MNKEKIKKTLSECTDAYDYQQSVWPKARSELADHLLSELGGIGLIHGQVIAVLEEAKAQLNQLPFD